MAEWKEYDPVGEFVKRLPVKESGLVQLGCGRLELASIDVRGRASFINRFKAKARSIWTMVPEEDWIGLLVPLSWSQEYVLNGMAASEDSVFMVDSTVYDTVTECRNTLTVGLRRSHLECVIGPLIGKGYRIGWRGPRLLSVPQAHRRQLISTLSAAIDSATPADASSDVLHMPAAIEVTLITALADWIIQLQNLDVHPETESRTNLQIVRESLNFIRQRDVLLLSIADLCRATGVKKTRLHEAFVETYGITPGHFLYNKRLMSAYEKLLMGDCRSQSVKNVAIGHGFLSSGQFARAYRSMFSELPSETLRRTASDRVVSDRH